jgi:hypothetical protein
VRLGKLGRRSGPWQGSSTREGWRFRASSESLDLDPDASGRPFSVIYRYKATLQLARKEKVQ